MFSLRSVFFFIKYFFCFSSFCYLLRMFMMATIRFIISPYIFLFQIFVVNGMFWFKAQLILSFFLAHVTISLMWHKTSIWKEFLNFSLHNNIEMNLKWEDWSCQPLKTSFNNFIQILNCNHFDRANAFIYQWINTTRESNEMTHVEFVVVSKSLVHIIHIDTSYCWLFINSNILCISSNSIFNFICSFRSKVVKISFFILNYYRFKAVWVHFNIREQIYAYPHRYEC